MSKMQSADTFTRKDPPLPPLSKPDPVTIHDLTAEQRQNIEIFTPGVAGMARKWRWKQGYTPSS